jgi:hypothetical protein
MKEVSRRKKRRWRDDLIKSNEIFNSKKEFLLDKIAETWIFDHVLIVKSTWII